MKLSILEVACMMGFGIKQFKIKKGKKAGTIDPKKTVLATERDGASVRIAALRALTKVRPLAIKKGDHTAYAFFTNVQLNRRINVTNLG